MRGVLAPGLRAVAHNWRPFVLIQSLAICLAVLYYVWPPLGAAFQAVSGLKAQWGYLFSFVTNAFAGAVLPEIAKRATMRGQKPTGALDMAFQLVFFGVLGMYIDFLYRSLGVWFGDQQTVGIIAQKAVFDQFVSTPTVAISYSVLAFVWRDNGFRFGQTWAAVRSGEFVRRYPSLLVSAWAFWIPVVCAVYAMPNAVQFVLFLCSQAAWSLVLLHMNSTE